MGVFHLYGRVRGIDSSEKYRTLFLGYLLVLNWFWIINLDKNKSLAFRAILRPGSSIEKYHVWGEYKIKFCEEYINNNRPMQMMRP